MSDIDPPESIRVHHAEHSSAQIDRAWPGNPRLSLRAKGIMVLCLSRRKGTALTAKLLWESSKDGRDAIKAGLHELSEHGYAELTTLRNKRGNIIGTRWIIHEKPTKIRTKPSD